MPHFQHKSGFEAHDVVTGFKGIITGRADYITGCHQYLLSPQECKDGKPVESQWFDEDRITVHTYEPRLSMNTPPMQEEAPARTGGPQRHPAPIK